MNHTDLLNWLIERHNLKSYLEIGVQNVANNYLKVNAFHKTGVDPTVSHPLITHLTSDQFFKVNKASFNLIFIDGLHHADQVKRDFENSLKSLNDKGFIVIHDCLPVDEITTCVPRGTQKIWNGDVYKFIFELNSYDGIDYKTYDFDHGCCVVWKDASKIGGYKYDNIDWQFYQNNKKLMRVESSL